MCQCPSTSSSNPVSAVHIPSSYLQTPTEGFDGPAFGILTWHTIISSPKTSSDTMCCGLATCPPLNGSLALHRHTQAEIYHVTEGKGIVIIDGVEFQVEKGSTLFIPGDAEHGVRNEGEEELKWFYVFPCADFGDVKYRFS